LVGGKNQNWEKKFEAKNHWIRFWEDQPTPKPNKEKKFRDQKAGTEKGVGVKRVVSKKQLRNRGLKVNIRKDGEVPTVRETKTMATKGGELGWVNFPKKGGSNRSATEKTVYTHKKNLQGNQKKTRKLGKWAMKNPRRPGPLSRMGFGREQTHPNGL